MKLLEFDTSDYEDTFLSRSYQFISFLTSVCAENEETIALRVGVKAGVYLKLTPSFMILPIPDKKGLIGHWCGIPVYKDKTIPADCALDIIDQDNNISHTIYLANMP